jgi:ubiquinone/menaquinone biosynthesis C-methylase UbiE
MDHDVDFYSVQYGGFFKPPYAAVRAETYDEDIGQDGWLTAQELREHVRLLQVGAETSLLDVACGSGGPAVHVTLATGCGVLGIDIHPDAVTAARHQAETAGVGGRARFERADASRGLPCDDDAFDVVVCIDAINHLLDRRRVLEEWRRVLRPGGLLWFTDPVVVTGQLSNEEFAARSSIGRFIFAPVGVNEQLLELAGFRVLSQTDTTEQVATTAGRWNAARARHARELRELEGDAAFDGQQRFLAAAAILARERRLSRFTYLAVRNGSQEQRREQGATR